MMIRHTALVSALFAAANALILHPTPPIRRNSVALRRALNDKYDGRPSYRRYQRDGGESKNRFNVRNSESNNYSNNEDDAYQLARELASRRGLHLSRDQEPPNIPMDAYSDDYRDAPKYRSEYNKGVPEQEVPRIPMDYNANNNYNEGYGAVGGGLKDLTWGGLKEQNDKKYKERYEVMESQRRGGRDSMGQRYKNPQPPRQPPREVRPSDFRNRNDILYQSGPSSQRSQSSSMGRRPNFEEVRRLQQTRQPPKSRSNSNSVYPFEMNRVNKLSELASTPTRIDSSARRSMSQYPAPNAQYRPNIPYQQPHPFRVPSTLAGFASVSEQMGRSGSATYQFMPPPPPPPYVQMPQYQQQRRQPSNLRPTSIPLSQLALQPHIQPVDQPSQQSQSYSAEFSKQQFQQMSGVYNDRRQQQHQPPPPPPSFAAGRNQSESFGGNQSASFTPLPFQQLSQADFTRPFQGSQVNQQQTNTFSNNSNHGAARQPPPDFYGPPPPYDQGGPPPPFGQDMPPPPPPPPFGPDVHIFQNPFMNEPMFQKPHKSTQPNPKGDNVKVPQDPNVEKMRRRTVSQSSSNNPGTGMKIPKDPLIERLRREQQQSPTQSNDGERVPKDPFKERQRLQMRKADTSAHAKSSNQEVKVPKEPIRNHQTTERRPKEPQPKTSPNMRIPREPTPNARREKIPREPRNGSSMDSKGDDMTYEDFASFFDMPKL